MFIVQVEINSSKESSHLLGPVVSQEDLVVCRWIGYYYYWAMNICLQTKFREWNEFANFVVKFATNFQTWKVITGPRVKKCPVWNRQ